MQEQIIVWVSEFWNEAKSKGYLASNVPMPTILFDLKGRVAGQAFTGANKLRFNLPLLARTTIDDVKETVGHEVVHIVTDKFYNRRCKHNQLWKGMMIRFGLKPERCHSIDTEGLYTPRRVKRYAVACACQTHYVSSNLVSKIKRGKGYQCKKCKQMIVLDKAKQIV